MTILVTGATGFVGRAVIHRLHEQGYHVIGTSRRPNETKFPFDIEIRHYDFEADTNYETLLKGVDVICHTASWATMWGHKNKEYAKYYIPTKKLIDEAKKRGVKRFILTSTIAANRKSSSLLKDNNNGHKYGLWPHLDYLIDLEDYMSSLSDESFCAISLRLGHFIGAGNTLGVLPVFLPRLKTFLVPWINGGKSLLPVIGPKDIAQAFEKSINANIPGNDYKFNITSENTPTMRNFLLFIHEHFGYPQPWFSVPYWFTYVFAFLCEGIALLTFSTPFLSRALVHLAEHWETDNHDAKIILGYNPTDNWQEIVKNHVSFLHKRGLRFSLKNN
jgi:nucleoside-diphosphate-sugar epimerase